MRSTVIRLTVAAIVILASCTNGDHTSTRTALFSLEVGDGCVSLRRADGSRYDRFCFENPVTPSLVWSRPIGGAHVHLLQVPPGVRIVGRPAGIDTMDHAGTWVLLEGSVHPQELVIVVRRDADGVAASCEFSRFAAQCMPRGGA